jgi:hypothetical protein
VAIGLTAVATAVAVSAGMLLPEGVTLAALNATNSSAVAIPSVDTGASILWSANGTNEYVSFEVPELNESIPVTYIWCNATDLDAEVKQQEALVDFVIEGLPVNFTTQEKHKLEEIFQLSYNALSGMCAGEFQRKLQNVTSTK